MTTEIIRYQIVEENAQAFEKAYQKAESILQASKHCLGYRMLRGQEEAQNWILMIEWDSSRGTSRVFAESLLSASSLRSSSRSSTAFKK
jgi:quinol monooxygenase YgiN